MAADTSCPQHIEAKIIGDRPYPHNMAGLHDRLLACAGGPTSSLDLRVAGSGCSDWPDRHSFPFNLKGGDHYPNLTELKLDGYWFDDCEWNIIRPPSWEDTGRFPGSNKYAIYLDLIGSWISTGHFLRWLSMRRNVPAERMTMTNLDLWLEAMDWSQLERLELLSGIEQHFVEAATPYLRRLRHLTVTSGHGRRRITAEETGRFVASLPTSLVSLSWCGGWDSATLDDVLDKHGPTLRTLDLHVVEGGLPPPALSAAQLRRMSEKAPNLQHIALNIDRDGTWPWVTLEALACQPALQSAEVWLELASECMRNAPQYWGVQGSEHDRCKGDERYRKPFLTMESASEVFSFLQSKKVGQELMRVEFWIGDWTPYWDGPLRVDPWIDGQRAKIVCDVMKENGSRVKEGGFVCQQIEGDKYGGGPLWEQLEQTAMYDLEEELEARKELWL